MAQVFLSIHLIFRFLCKLLHCWCRTCSLNITFPVIFSHIWCFSHMKKSHLSHIRHWIFHRHSKGTKNSAGWKGSEQHYCWNNQGNITFFSKIKLIMDIIPCSQLPSFPLIKSSWGKRHVHSVIYCQDAIIHRVQTSWLKTHFQCSSYLNGRKNMQVESVNYKGNWCMC